MIVCALAGVEQAFGPAKSLFSYVKRLLAFVA